MFMLCSSWKSSLHAYGSLISLMFSLERQFWHHMPCSPK